MAETRTFTLDGVDYEVDKSLSRKEARNQVLAKIKEEEKLKDLQEKKVEPKVNETLTTNKEVKSSETQAYVSPLEGYHKDGLKSGSGLQLKTKQNNFLKTKVFGERYVDQDPDNSIYDADLIKDEKFVTASKVIFEMNKGRAWDFEADGSEEDLAKYGISAMGWFNYNLGSMVMDSAGLLKAEQYQKEAFLYAMEAYDDLGMSLNGTYRLAAGMALDLTNWAALFTFGSTAIAAQTAKVATKEGVKQLLLTGLKALPYGVVNGAVYGTVDATGREIVRSGGTQTDFDLGNVGEGTIKGAAFGGGLTFGGSVGINAARSVFSRKSGEIGNKLFGKGKPSDYINDDDIFKAVDVGVKVKASDKGNIGTVTEIVDGKAKVSFINKKTKATTVKEFSVDSLKSVDRKPISIRDDLNKIIDETPGKLRTSIQNLLTKIDEVLPAGTGKGGLRDDGTQSLEDLKALTQDITDYLTKMGANEPAKFSRFIDEAKLTREQEQLLMVAAQTVTETYLNKMVRIAKSLKNDALSMEDYNKLFTKWSELNDLKKPIQEVYNTISGQSGATLRSTQVEGKYTLGKGRNLDIEDFLKTNSEDATITEFLRITDFIDNQVKQSAKVKNLKEQYTKLIEDNKFKEARKVRREHDITVAEEKYGAATSVFGKTYGAINYAFRIFNEVAISNVFSSSTLIINTIPSFAKTFYKPLVNNLGTDGFTWKAYKQMTAEYSAIAGAANAARKAAIFSFNYERSILTGDTARFLETQTMIPKKLGGGFVRIFPRLLLTTDAIFEQIMYRQYVVGEATAKVIEDGFKKGHSKAKINADLKKQTEKSIKQAYEPIPNAADLLTDQAVDLGILGRGGKSVDDWVAGKLEKFENDPDILMSATNKNGRDAVQDALFKRKFDKDNPVGKLLDQYEGLVNRHPIIRFFGQLFFRTPVRVLEEGMRLTPGLNLIMPSFRRDLQGGAGVPRHRHARAAGEALFGQAIAGSAVALYMTGNITGAQGTDYKITRHGEDAGYLPPYSIRNPLTGAVTNWRNLDPFSTPLKLLVNSFEALQEIAYREQQGEYVGEAENKKATDQGIVAYTILLKLITDGNLFAGVTDGVEFIQDLASDDYDSEILIWLGKKLQTVIPNQHFKYQMLGHPVLGDAQGVEESLLYRLNPTKNPEIDSILETLGFDSSSIVNVQHTALGDERLVSSPAGAIWGIFDGITVEEKDARYKVKNPDGSINEDLTSKKSFVLNKIANIAQATNSSFYASVKPTGDNWLGVDNAKEVFTKANDKYPKESIYMRMQRILKEKYQAQMINKLYDLLKDKTVLGTPSTKGMFKTESHIIISDILNGYRELAYADVANMEKTIPQVLDFVGGQVLKNQGSRESNNNILRGFN